MKFVFCYGPPCGPKMAKNAPSKPVSTCNPLERNGDHRVDSCAKEILVHVSAFYYNVLHTSVRGLQSGFFTQFSAILKEGKHGCPERKLELKIHPRYMPEPTCTNSHVTRPRRRKKLR